MPLPFSCLILFGFDGYFLGELQSSGTTSTDYFLKNLTGCTIVIRDVLSALKIEGLCNCSLYIGPVSGSVFVRNCKDCTVFVVARQLRIHDSLRCSWFVQVRSCARITTANACSWPLPFTVTSCAYSPDSIPRGPAPRAGGRGHSLMLSFHLSFLCLGRYTIWTCGG